MAGDSQEPDEQLRVDDIGVLKVLADTLRLRIVELLRERAATVKEMAAVLETSPKSLYYHVNLLERSGLIRVVGTRIVSGILEKRYRATAYVFKFPDLSAQGDGRDRASAQDYVTNLIEVTKEEIRLGTAQGWIDGTDLDGASGRGMHWNWRFLKLQPREAAALAGRMCELLAEFEARAATAADGDRQTYRLFQVLFPTYHRDAPGTPSTPDAPAERQ
jgi:DNA-binding transcriptional ArsR family regulator